MHSAKPSTSSAFPLHTKPFCVEELGFSYYKDVWTYQRQLQAKRQSGEIPDTLLFVEHEPIYTLGVSGKESNITGSQEFLSAKGIKVLRVDRGGDVTFHGPGQIVGYPIFDLKQHTPDVSWYMRSLERVLIETLAHFGIRGTSIANCPGVWVGIDKIAALGVRISKWVTMHGFALNVSTDLDYFSGIIPCGIQDKSVTSMDRVLGYAPPIETIKEILVNEFSRHFRFEGTIR